MFVKNIILAINIYDFFFKFSLFELKVETKTAYSVIVVNTTCIWKK